VILEILDSLDQLVSLEDLDLSGHLVIRDLKVQLEVLEVQDNKV